MQAIASSSTPIFKSLETTWRFQPASPSSPHLSSSPPPHPSPPLDTTKQGIDAGPTLLSIDLEYEFVNPLHTVIAARAFGKVSDMMVDAFERRCLEVYGMGKA
jgi:coenzyme Q-binding protein COQ10